MRLTADVDGDYIFTYTYDSQLLTVTYPEKEQAIDVVDAAKKAVKKLINGQLIIEKNGRSYNAQGIVVE